MINMKNLLLVILIFFPLTLWGQGKKEVVKYQIKSKTELKADYKNGNGKLLPDEKYLYDKNGNVVQETLYDSFGKLKKETKFYFNNENLLEKEEEYNGKGKLVLKTIYTYNEKKLKTSKKVFDGNEKLLVEKTYSYEYY